MTLPCPTVPPNLASLQPLLAALHASPKPLSTRGVMAALESHGDSVSVASGLALLVENGLARRVPSDGPNTLYGLPVDSKKKAEGAPPAAKGAGLSMSARILEHLRKAGRELPMVEIRAAMGADAARVSSLVYALVQSGKVRRRGHRREALFSLTSWPSNGETTAAAANDAVVSSARDIVDALVGARRAADRLVRDLALRSTDAELVRAATLARELDHQVECLITELRGS